MTKTLCCSALLLTAVVILSVSPATSARHGGNNANNPDCPAPSVSKGGQCVLEGDAVLTDTLQLPSFVKLNCQGHRLMPASAGVLDNPHTTANEFQPSQPELAILVHQATDTKIQNCHIEGFDFGILLAETKTQSNPAGQNNKILANTIDVRTNAIALLKSDGALIADNQLTYAAERGRGVIIEFDSDDNRIVNNTITSTDAASTGQVRIFPGGFFVNETAVMDNEIHCLNATRPLQNIVLGGHLFQIRSLDPQAADLEDSGRSDHNVIEGNTITDRGFGSTCTLDPATACRANGDCTGKGTCLLKQNSGVAFNFRAGNTTVRGNSISGRMARGISFGGTATTFTANFTPGTCSLDHMRLCIDNTDCNLAGFDQTSKGTCMGAISGTANGNSVGLLAEDNRLNGNFDNAAMFAANTDDFSFRGNFVEGGGSTVSGIQLQSTALTGILQRNIVNGAQNALFLAKPSAPTWLISLNDFTGYLTAVRTTNDYNLPTDLGGNYWGLLCPGFDPNLVRYENGLVNPFVTDSHAYGVSVATTPDSQLPGACQ